MFGKYASRASSAMLNTLGSAGRTAAIGAGAGGMYGAVSNDTSVLGSAAMGAAAGLGGRYARAGIKATTGVGRGMAMGAHGKALGQAFGGGVARKARRDYSRTVSKMRGVRSNSGFANSTVANRNQSVSPNAAARAASNIGPSLSSNGPVGGRITGLRKPNRTGATSFSSMKYNDLVGQGGAAGILGAFEGGNRRKRFMGLF